MRNKRLIILFSILLSITLIVLIGSILFSVKPDNINTYCYNYLDDTIESDGSTLSQQVLGQIDIDNKSIFLINQQKLIEQIEDNIHNVKVINIERKFPNRVTVNYIKLFDFFQVKLSGKYYSLRHDGRITKISDESPQLIELRCDIKGEFEEGDNMFKDENSSILSDIAIGLETVGIDNFIAPLVINFIDTAKSDNDIIYLGMADGTIIQIWGKDKLTGKEGKLRLGISVYADEGFDPIKFKSIVVVWDNTNSKAMAYKKPENVYL